MPVDPKSLTRALNTQVEGSMVGRTSYRQSSRHHAKAHPGPWSIRRSTKSLEYGSEEANCAGR